MSTATFDTFEFNKALREGGFDERQAETLTKAQAKVVEQTAHDGTSNATKQDVVELKKDMTEMKADIFRAMMLQTFAIAGLVIAVVKFMN